MYGVMTAKVQILICVGSFAINENFFFVFLAEPTNISKDERKAIKELKEESVLILPGDKGKASCLCYL